MKSEQLVSEYRQAAKGLVVELARMHGVLFTLIMAMRSTELSAEQRGLLEEAGVELGKSEERFWSQYGGVGPPEEEWNE